MDNCYAPDPNNKLGLQAKIWVGEVQHHYLPTVSVAVGVWLSLLKCAKIASNNNMDYEIFQSICLFIMMVTIAKQNCISRIN